MRRMMIGAALALAMAACSPQPADKAETPQPLAEAQALAPASTPAPAGVYKMDPNHASLLVRVDHFGLSHYTARFTQFDASVSLDPADPAKSSVTATVNPRSIRTEYPDDYRARHPGSLFANFDDDIALSDRWLSAAAFPQATFRSTSVTLTGPDTADVTGELTIRGETHPMTFKAVFNGGFAAHPFNPQGPARIGLSARGTFKRSEYGMNFMQAGDAVGVGDEVELIVEAEFDRQDGAEPAAAGDAAPSVE